jgi:plasmid stability protein
MKSIHVRSVPDETLLRLKRRAARHHRSLQQEIQVLLENAARMLPADAPLRRSLDLKIVQSGISDDSFNRADFYGDDGR